MPRPPAYAPPLIGFLLVSLLGHPRARGAEPDPWFGRDKALHFSISAAIAAGGYAGAAIALGDGRRRWRWVAGMGLALGAGVGKEVADHYGSGDASFRDLTWDLVGAATGAGLAWVVDVLLLPSRATDGRGP